MKNPARHAMKSGLAPSRKLNNGGHWFECEHDHKLTGTAVFFQSLGVLQCNACGGYQAIKKPLN